MPPKAKITKEMILDAAFEIARTEGEKAINARALSQRLNCSTQPILYYYASIEEIRSAAFQKAEQYHTAYFMTVTGEFGNPLLEIAMRYIRFADQEKYLFRFLFQSDRFGNRNIADWVRDEKIRPILTMMADQAKITSKQAADLFLSVYVIMHGYASMFANNSMEFDEASIIQTIQRAFWGIVGAMKAE